MTQNERVVVFLSAILSLSGLQAACSTKSELPEVARKPLPYNTSRLTLSECASELPPVQDDDKNCPADEIGRSVREEDACLMLKALKGWMSRTPLAPPQMQPNDWTRIRAVLLCRTSERLSATASPRWRITIYADVPERPRLFWVDMLEESRVLGFGAVHRGGL